MSDNRAPRSAYELAMERLRKQDEEAGIERQVVTAERDSKVTKARSSEP